MKIIKVGRSSKNDIVIQHDNNVSRTHCQFIKDDNGDYSVIDLNSLNGTFVNGVRRSGKTRLKPNDTVRIGNSMLPWQTYFNGIGTDSVGGTVVQPPVFYPPVDDSIDEPKPCAFGIAALVCGVLGLSIVAIVFGAVAMGRNERNRGLGIAGLILGIVGVCVTLVLVCLGIDW